ncbi:MAG: FAD-binding oxidoreductase [candidate division WOR-3 bacterium]
MALPKEAFRELEDIVGPENISEDPTIMPAYFNTAFAAVVLPGSVEEIRAIVLVCNKYKIPFRAICTGWTGRFQPGTLLLDLRRMNRIIEINERNLYAVVEPYVTLAQLQAELWKRGLHCNVKGAGTNCTALLRGHGHLDQSTSADDRNYLAVEWVTPTGKVVRTGALGLVGEWYTGDGPGPSLRALISGAVPPGVTPGVITKAAIKLYHWPGPAYWDVKGTNPHYYLEELPPNFFVRYYWFPDVDRMLEAEARIGESEIALELMGFNLSMVVANITTSNEEEEKLYDELKDEVKGPGFLVILGGLSEADLSYKRKVLEMIVKETDGHVLSITEDPKVQGLLLIHCTRICASVRETFRAGGAFRSIPVMGQRDLVARWAVGAAEAKRSLIARGLVVDDGGHFFGWGVEHGHLGKTEIFCRYDPRDPEAAEAVEQWYTEQTERALQEGYFANFMLPWEKIRTSVGPRLCNFHIWWEEVMDIIDPLRLTTSSPLV